MEELEPEEWVDIKGYEGIYQISNHGKVKSLARTIKYSNGHSRKQKERLLRVEPVSSHGYPNVNLYKDEVPHLTLVHRLVAEHFIDNPDPENLRYVNHKYGVRTDNYYKHLEWVTHQQNLQHAVDTGLYKCIGSDNHQAKTVINCRGEIFHSIIEAGNHFGLSNVSRIGDVCAGKRKHAGKYPDGTLIKWEYYPESN